MLLYFITVVIFWSGSCKADSITQSQLSITKRPGAIGVITCKLEKGSFQEEIIHWYRQTPGKNQMEWLLYFKSATTKDSVPNADIKSRFIVKKWNDRNTCTLAIQSVKKEDTAIYYCAYWSTTLPYSLGHFIQKKHVIVTGYTS
ncbi:hypothetical protein HHUSO_G4918 [Huso huso]|uniref:Ig-like domain-containing protein n=1 Tax=Huso huso TaxID=61971 RepID=A0ABR0ZZZ3_HUSHU